jgi:hypothetical protein
LNERVKDIENRVATPDTDVFLESSVLIAGRLNLGAILAERLELIDKFINDIP